MELRDYLHFERKTLVSFSNSINYHVRYVSACMHGRSKPGKKLIQIIKKATDGKVTEKDWKDR